MASVPQSMMMARSKKKKMQREIFIQAGEMEERYNNKMMDSIWGQYNRYSVHNMKSMQNEDAMDMQIPPVIQILREHENQSERSGSPVMQMLQGHDMGRSRPLNRVMQEHRREAERSRSPSLSDMFLEEEHREERSESPFQQMINNHKSEVRRCDSPLMQLAKEHYEGMNPIDPFQGAEMNNMANSERGGITRNSGLFGNSVYNNFGGNLLSN